MASRMTGWILTSVLLLSTALYAKPPSSDSDSREDLKFRYSEATVAHLQTAMAARTVRITCSLGVTARTQGDADSAATGRID